MVLKGVGIAFILIGVMQAVISKISCRSLCSVCTSEQLSPCFFLFIFAGIIFIVSGLSLLNVKKNNLSKVKLKKKLK